MKPGEAIDYLRGGPNRRVTAQVYNEAMMFRWNRGLEARGLEARVNGAWAGVLLTHFMEYGDYTKARELPRAPTGCRWSEETDDGVALIDLSGTPYSPIAIDQERDIQAARVAEFDTRPEPEETAE